MEAALRRPFEERQTESNGVIDLSGICVNALRTRIERLVSEVAPHMVPSGDTPHAMNEKEEAMVRLLPHRGDRHTYLQSGATVGQREQYQGLLGEKYDRMAEQGRIVEPNAGDRAVLENYARAWVLSGETLDMLQIPGLRRFALIRELEEVRHEISAKEEKESQSASSYLVPVVGAITLFGLYRLLSRQKDPVS